MVTPRIRQDRSKNVPGHWFSRLLALPLCGLILLGQAGLGVALPTSQAAPIKNQRSDTLAHSKAILPHTKKPLEPGSGPRVSATASQRGGNAHTHGLVRGRSKADGGPGFDLSLTMSSNNGSCVSIGDPATFSLVVTNGSTMGPPLEVISITDTLPVGLTNVSAVGPGWQTSISGTTVTASFVTMTIPPGLSLAPLTIIGTVSTPVGSTLNNTATLSDPNDTDLTNNTASSSINVCPRPDLAIQKSHIGAGPFQVGQSVSYSLNVSNIQNAGAVENGQSITVTDSIPSGLTNVIASGGSDWTITPTAGTITAAYKGLYPIAPNSNMTPITVTGTLTSQSLGNLANTATVSTPLDIDTNNNTSNDSITVGPGPDLAIVKTHQGTGPFQVGQTASFVLSVSNVTGNGAVLAGQSITVTDQIPAAFSNPVAVGTDWNTSITGGLLTATYSGSLPISAGTTLSDIVVTGQLTSDAPPTLSNTATVSTPNDANPDNDSNSNSITVLPLPDLKVSLTHQTNKCVAKGIMTYTLQVSNNDTAGPVLSGPISVSATLPAELGGLSGTASSGWNVITNGSTLTATYTGNYPINPGTSLQPILISGALANPGSPSLLASATVTLTNDGNNEDNTTNDVLTICPPDLTLVKTHQGTGPFQIGQNFGFVLTVSNGDNAGPVFAGNSIVVSDQLPVGLSNVTAIGTNWSTDITNGLLTATYTNVQVATGETLPPIVVSGQLNSAAAPNLTNTASVSTTGDNNAGNDTSTDTVPVLTLPDLTLSISHAGTGCNPTSAINYTLIVNNVGNASGPVLTDPITVTFTTPGNLSNVNVSTGSDWLASKNGADYTLTYTGSYPFDAGTALSPITVTGNVFGSTVSLSSTVTTATDSDHSNDTSSNTIAICSPNLAIVKTHNTSGVFQVGQPATFTLTVSNLAGSGTIQTGEPITVTDQLPTSLINPIASGTNWKTAISDGVLTATYTGDYPIVAGTTLLPITITGQLTADAAPTLDNTATVETLRDSNLSNNTSTDSIPVLAAPDLSVNLTHADVECNKTYTISDILTVSDNGKGGPVLPNQPITLQIPAPSNLTNITVTPVVSGDWQVTQNNDKSWTATYSGSYPVAADSVLSALTITGDATTYAPSLSATVTTPFDSDNSNDSATDTLTICAPDLAITKTHTGTAPFQAGQNVDFILNVSDVADSGPVLTGNTITISDTLPSGLVSPVANGSPDWTTSIDNNTLVATYAGTLPINPGTTLPPLHLSGQLNVYAMPTLSNSATVSGVPNDSNPANNLATDSFPVISTPDLALTVTAPQSCLHIGDTVSYSLQVSNASNVGMVLASSPVTVSIPIPTNLSNVTIGGGWQGPTGPIDGGSTVTLTYAGNYPIAPGATLPVITISGTFTTPSTTFVASGLVSTLSDSNSSNDEGSATLTMCGPDLRISKDHRGTGPFIVGNTVNYFLKVSLSPGSNPILEGSPITVTDVIPAGLSSVVAAGNDWTFTTDNGTLTATYTGPYPVTTDSAIPYIALSGQLNTAALPILFNTVTVNVPEDNNPNNNSWTDQIPVQIAPDLRLHVNSPGSCVRHSNKATFTFAVSSDSQAGPISTPITLSFAVPSGLDKVSFSGSSWDWHKNGSKVTANYIGNFPVTPGQNLGLFKMTGVVTKSAGGTVGFSAKVTVGDDSHTTNNVSYGKLKVCSRLSVGNGGTGTGSNNPGGSNNNNGNNGHHGSNSNSGSDHNNGSNPGGSGGQGYPGLPPTGSDPERRSV